MEVIFRFFVLGRKVKLIRDENQITVCAPFVLSKPVREELLGSPRQAKRAWLGSTQISNSKSQIPTSNLQIPTSNS